jgi:L-asparaginase
MTEQDRRTIAEAVRAVPHAYDAILILHGTDTLQLTGEYLYAALPQLQRPIVLTGSMRPFEFRDTDAFQNVHEAILACRIAPPGVYCVMHSKILRFPGVIKDRGRMTFIKTDAAPLYPPASRPHPEATKPG